MSTSQAGQTPMNEADEATPLLTNERPADVEAQKDEPTSAPRNWVQFWTNIQVLTTCSLTFCSLVLLGSLIHYIWTDILRNGRYYYNYPIQEYMHTGTFICTWTAIISILNYARLRLDGSQLPWSFNLIVDFVVFISALFTSILFFLTVALHPCDSRSYYDCPKLNNPVVIIGMIEMIFVLGLALTHMMLLVMRIRVPPQQGNSLFGGGSAASGGGANPAGVGVSGPSPFSFSDGWFCGFGRGPIGVAVQSMPENSRSTTQGTQAHTASA